MVLHFGRGKLFLVFLATASMLAFVFRRRAELDDQAFAFLFLNDSYTPSTILDYSHSTTSTPPSPENRRIVTAPPFSTTTYELDTSTSITPSLPPLRTTMTSQNDTCSVFELKDAGDRKRPLPRLLYHNRSAYQGSPWQDVQLLPTEVLDSAFQRSPGNLTLLDHMLLRLKANQSVNIQVRGGSMTYGVGCERDGGFANLSCAWSSFFATHLRQAFPNAEVKVDMRAKRGTTLTADFADIVADFVTKGQPPDLIIYDYSQNGEEDHEPLVRATRMLLPSTQILIVWTGCRTKKPRSKDDVTKMFFHGQIAKMAKHYSLPFASYVDAEDTFAAQGGDYSVMWDLQMMKHPRWHTHGYIADILVRWVNRELEKLEACDLSGEAPSRPFVQRALNMSAPYHVEAWKARNADVSSYLVCFQPLAFYDALHPTDSAPRSSATGVWRLYEERQGKPGWIADSTRESITFQVNFSQNPKLLVTYLRSYTPEWGEVNVYLGDTSLGKLHSRWPELASLSDTRFFGKKELPKVKQYEPYNLSLRLSTAKKFKLLAVMSC